MVPRMPSASAAHPMITATMIGVRFLLVLLRGPEATEELEDVDVLVDDRADVGLTGIVDMAGAIELPVEADVELGTTWNAGDSANGWVVALKGST